MAEENLNIKNTQKAEGPPKKVEIPQVTGVPQREASPAPQRATPQKPTEAPKPSVETVPKPVPEAEPEQRSAIRTFEADVANALKQGKESLSSIALKEQERREETGEVLPKKSSSLSKKSLGVFILIILFIVLGAGAIYFALSGEENDIVETKDIFTNPIIFTDNQSVLDTTTLNRNDLISALAEKRREYSGTVGSIENIYLTTGTGVNERLVTGREILESLGTNADGSLIRNMADNFMYGIHAFDGNDAFFIFKIKNFETVFARMLDWEEVLLDDLAPILYDNLEEEFVFQVEGEVGLNEEVRFEDVVVKSRDTRSLKDLNGKEALIYAFPDRETLIITTNRDTLSEIFTRLTASRL